MRARNFGESAAEINVRADVIYAGGQSLQYEGGLVGSQGELADELPHVFALQERKRHRWDYLVVAQAGEL